MASKKTVYYCTKCGYESIKWQGKCPNCDAWNSFCEETISTKSKVVKRTDNIPRKITDINIDETKRLSTGYKELDRVLGGGIVEGSLVLVGGDPGIGKSTMLLQLSKTLTDNKNSVLYISGEESYSQIKLRSLRLGKFNDELDLLCETDLEIVENSILSKKPKVVIIDSIQTMNSGDISSVSGSVAQIKEATNRLLFLSKTNNISIFIVGHVTKQGEVAGPKILEHMVDTVLYFEGEKYGDYRILRAVKNRFGSTNEIGIFRMSQNGLYEVSSLSEIILEGRENNSFGSAITCSIEGSRPVLLEIQGLTSKANYAVPIRNTSGMDYKRVNMLIAVIEKNLKLDLSKLDIYMNIVGGIKADEPAIDLAIVLSVISSYKEKGIDSELLVFGEIGLSGEIRGVNMSDSRVKEGVKLGFKKFIIPFSNKKEIEKIQLSSDIKIRYIKNILEIKEVFESQI